MPSCQAAKVLGEYKAVENYGSHALKVKAAFRRTYVMPGGIIKVITTQRPGGSSMRPTISGPLAACVCSRQQGFITHS